MKRILSLLVALAMVIAMVPSVFAAKDQIDMDELLGKLVILDSIDEFNVVMVEGANTKTYKWTPEKDGTLSVYYYFWEMPEGTEIDITMIQGEKSITYSQLTEDAEFALNVVADVEVSIVITKTSEAAFEMPFYGEFVEPEGTEGNPILLYELENTVTAEAATWYKSFMNGTTMTITADAPFNVTINGEQIASENNAVSAPVVANRMMDIPFVFCLNDAGTYQIQFEYPLGSDMNPAQLVMGENTAEISAGTQGYYFNWCAEKGGTLTITMPEGNWFYTVNNLTRSQYGDEQTSASDPVQSVCEVVVMEGDEIELIVNTFDPENPYEAPAGTLVVTAAFEEAANSEANPIIIQPAWNEESTVATATVTAPVGTTYYGAYNFGGMMLSIDGGEATQLEAMPPMPAVFSITNEGTEEKEYTLVFTFAPGSFANPAQLVMGENTATIPEGSWEGYLFTWTAEEDGKLTITMPEGDWFYVVNNITAGLYGDSQTSDMNPVLASTTVDVKAGDEIQVNVNTFDPNNMWNNPAGTLVITASFKAPSNVPGDLDADGILDEADAIYLVQHLLMEEDFPIEQSADYDKNGTVNEEDAIYLLQHLLMPEDFPLA